MGEVRVPDDCRFCGNPRGRGIDICERCDRAGLSGGCAHIVCERCKTKACMGGFDGEPCTGLPSDGELEVLGQGNLLERAP